MVFLFLFLVCVCYWRLNLRFMHDGVHSTTVLHFQLSCIIFYFSVSDPFEMNFVWYQKVDFFFLFVCRCIAPSSVCLEGIFLLCCVLLLFQSLFYQTTVMCFFFWPHYSLLSLSVVVSVLLLQRDTKIMVTLTKKKRHLFRAQLQFQKFSLFSLVDSRAAHRKVQEMWLRVVYLDSQATGRERE